MRCCPPARPSRWGDSPFSGTNTTPVRRGCSRTGQPGHPDAGCHSAAHLSAPVDFDGLNFRKRPWNAALAYGQSKTATALFAVEAQRRWSADGITANTCHPGAVMSNLGRHLRPEDMAGMPDYDFRTTEQGAATPTLLATWPGLQGKGSRYFEDGHGARRNEPGQESGVPTTPWTPRRRNGCGWCPM